MDKPFALKSLALSLSKIVSNFLMEQNRFLQDRSYTFTVLYNLVLTNVRHEVQNLESCVAIQGLEFAINIIL